MTARFELRRCQTFVINEPSHHDDGTDVEDQYTVYDFVPRNGVAPAVSLGACPPHKLGR
jgi:hypothetical protein